MKNKEEQYLYLLSAVVIITALVLLGWFSWQFYNKTEFVFTDDKQQSKKIEKKDDACQERRVLDGRCIDDTELNKNPKLIGVMIENHVDSRPASDLSDARIVYEAPVEGNISRFLAIYTENQTIEKVGPVRSARPYYVDWIREYGDIVYAHVGGSPAALDYIKKTNINDLDEFARGWYYWRSEDRSAPHNAYTSSDLWSKALVDYEDNYQDKDYKAWNYQEAQACSKKEDQVNTSTSTEDSTEDNCVKEIEITFAYPGYRATWKYNTSTEKYDRYQSGGLHQDADGDLIQADTIVVQHVNTKVLDAKGRLGMETIGSGKAEIYMKGQKIEGSWGKEDETARTQFYNSEEEKINLNPGKVWIEVVNQQASVEAN